MTAVKEMPMAESAGAEPAVSSTRTRILQILSVVTLLAVAYGAYQALFVVGMDVTQGNVQRIFYLHVSAFAGAAVAFGTTMVAGAIYLRTRNNKWDNLALAGVEVGFALGLMNLITGSIWARPIWNTWWTWDPRLTSAAIMILTYAAYLMLRNGIENPDTRRRFASVYGILAMSTVIITFVIIRIRPDTIHPAVIGTSSATAEGGFDMDATMAGVFGFNMAVWSILVPLVLVWWRVRLQNVMDRVQKRKVEQLSK